MKAKLVKMVAAVAVAMCCSLFVASAQNRTVSGTVTDSFDEPLAGVAVMVKGNTSIGTSTDLDGKYTLPNVPAGATLVFSFIGMDTQEVAVGSQSTINVMMNDSAELLDEMVVIGYGTVKKSDLTGAVSIVKPDEFKNKTNLSIGNALQGMAAGVSVRSNGDLGSVPTIQIRGTANLTNNDPLYVIDGMPTTNDIHFNTNDIESIQVLKDASAAAIYGSRAANGVVIITTKQGSAGKTKFNFNSQIAIQETARLNLAKADEWKEQYDEACRNGIAEGAEGVLMFIHWPYDTDWQEELYRTGIYQNYDFSFSGGSQTGNYRVSFNYMNDTGTIIERGMNRLTARVNSSGKVGIFTFGENLQVGNTSRTRTGGSPFLTVRMLPTVPVRVDENSPQSAIDAANTAGFGRGSLSNARTLGSNPVAECYNGTNFSNTIVIRGTAFAEAAITDWLKYRFSVGLDVNDGQTNSWGTGYATAMNNSDSKSSATASGNRRINSVVENTLSFNKTLGKHNLNGVLGYTYENGQTRDYNVRREDLMRSATGEWLTQVSTTTGTTTGSGSLQENTLLSYLGRVNYDYDGRYLFTVTARRDGSSRFAKEYRWGTFPSFSAAWRVSREKFFNVPWISDLKIRANYGTLGSQNVGNYDYQMFINNYPQYLFDGSTPTLGQTVASLANTNLSWETMIQKNIGIDASFFNNRLQTSLEFYDSESRDVLTRLPILMTTGNGGGDPYVNAASISNKGLELTVIWQDVVSNDFSYSINANVSHSKNELLSFGYGKTEQYTAHAYTGVGQPIGMFYLVKTLGIFQSMEEVQNHKNSKGVVIQPNAKPGDCKYEDYNDDGQITQGGDQQIIKDKSPWPKAEFGLTFNAQYKNFDFQIASYGQVGAWGFNETKRLICSFDDCNASLAGYDYWTPSNTGSKNARLIYGDERNVYEYIDRWLEDASFFRVSAISVGYNWKPTFLQGKIDSIRFGVTGQNLLTLTKWSGWDPDFTGSLLEPGVNDSAYPNAKSVIFSIGLNF